mmetsp:Transcript_12663/g.23739  ORF Transcript_12663/g.23739 Transcript_12663/m.23739 type:complete len:82 (+) Transcript_12663:851-1096(+)
MDSSATEADAVDEAEVDEIPREDFESKLIVCWIAVNTLLGAFVSPITVDIMLFLKLPVGLNFFIPFVIVVLEDMILISGRR